MLRALRNAFVDGLQHAQGRRTLVDFALFAVAFYDRRVARGRTGCSPPGTPRGHSRDAAETGDDARPPAPVRSAAETDRDLCAVGVMGRWYAVRLDMLRRLAQQRAAASAAAASASGSG